MEEAQKDVCYGLGRHACVPQDKDGRPGRVLQLAAAASLDRPYKYFMPRRGTGLLPSQTVGKASWTDRYRCGHVGVGIRENHPRLLAYDVTTQRKTEMDKKCQGDDAQPTN